MTAFDEHLASQLDTKLRERRILVWYDPRSEFDAFVSSLKPVSPPAGQGGLPRVWINDLQTHLAKYNGSFFALKAEIEPIASLDKPEPLLVYVPGKRRDRLHSVLMEVEKGGASQEWGLRHQARTALRSAFTDGEIDEMLAPEGISYTDITKLLSGGSAAGSLLKLALGEGSSEVLLARWIIDEDKDTLIAEKGATEELFKLVAGRLGLKLPDGTQLSQARHRVVRYVLANEFRNDLTVAAPASLDVVPSPTTQEQHRRIHEVAQTIRREGERYTQLADQVEQELGLAHLEFDPSTLGAIDTFRFEEARLLGYAAELLAKKQFADALEIVAARGPSFWLDRYVARRAQWEVCRLAGELGAAVAKATPDVLKTTSGSDKWVSNYSDEGGWFEIDRVHRALETWVASMDEDPEEALERAIGLVRRDHEALLQKMAEGYSAALVKGRWSVPNVLHQTQVYPEHVKSAGGRVAYFFVDAMRYEMGADLRDQLVDAEDVRLTPAIAALPSVTHVGMAALLPGASGSFAVVEHKGKLASRIDDTIMPGLPERKRLVSATLPQAKDIGLGTLLTKTPRQLKKQIGDAEVLIVRSQCIDKMGETDGGYMARQIMNTVIGTVARAVRKLAKLGIEYFVITADHGHQFGARKEEDMRMDKPGGETVEIHRRAWAGHGGQPAAASVKVSGAELGYDTDLDFIFPTGLAVFKAGGDVAFHHGGISLQEMVVPVLTLRIPLSGSVPVAEPNSVYLDNWPEAITNRMFSARITAIQLLGDEDIVVRLGLEETQPNAGAVAGSIGMAVGAKHFDRTTGVVHLEPSSECQVGFMLTNASAKSIRIVAHDPKTDAVVARSEELPVKLGIVE